MEGCLFRRVKWDSVDGSTQNEKNESKSTGMTLGKLHWVNVASDSVRYSAVRQIIVHLSTNKRDAKLWQIGQLQSKCVFYQ